MLQFFYCLSGVTRCTAYETLLLSGCSSPAVAAQAPNTYMAPKWIQPFRWFSLTLLFGCFQRLSEQYANGSRPRGMREPSVGDGFHSIAMATAGFY
jgi:hypothetical protein